MTVALSSVDETEAWSSVDETEAQSSDELTVARGLVGRRTRKNGPMGSAIWLNSMMEKAPRITGAVLGASVGTELQSVCAGAALRFRKGKLTAEAQ